MIIKIPVKDPPPQKKTLKKQGRCIYETDKLSVLTIAHRKNKYTSFSVEKKSSKDLISKKVDDFVDKETHFLQMSVPSIRILLNIKRIIVIS